MMRQPSPTVVKNHSLDPGAKLLAAGPWDGHSGRQLDVLLRVRLARRSEASENAAVLNLTLMLLRNDLGTESINVSLALLPQQALNNGRLWLNGTNTSAQWAKHPCANGRVPGTPFVYCACYPNCGTSFTVYPNEKELTLRVLLDVSIV